MMENSGYMSSPALMVLASSASEATRDAIHAAAVAAQHHHHHHHHMALNHQHHQLDKDMHLFGLRPVYQDSAASNAFNLPAHLLHVHGGHSASATSSSSTSQNHFLGGFAGGAFRPVAGSAAVAAAKMALEDAARNGFGSAFSSSASAAAASAASACGMSISPPGAQGHVKEESSDDGSSGSEDRLTETPASDCDQAEDHQRRPKKRPIFDGQTPCCPVCGITLRAGELESHFIQEVDKLSKLAKVARRSSKESCPGNKNSSNGNLAAASSAANGSGKKAKESSPGHNVVEKNGSPEARWETYQRVKSNRQSRLSARAKVKKRRQADEVTCPVCHERVTGAPEELNAHAEQCLRKREGHTDEDESVDVEGEMYEEYEWAGQTRIRATTLLQGGFSASGFQTMSGCRSAGGTGQDDEEDLNVDGDDSATYGQPQYGEVDVIPCSSDEPGEEQERRALRVAMLTGENGTKHIKTESCSKWAPEAEMGNFGRERPTEMSDVEGAAEDCHNPSSSQQTASSSLSSLHSGRLTQVVDSLKRRLRELEVQLEDGAKAKCLICMEPYAAPVVSVSCWHVHCEECWLRALGVKKLCPQCNMITSPNDLRRIYL